ncbi:MAG: hypothetical protein KatS3mg056_2441 [Chloroflexus sp.]|jgi:hypothetical protein|nr:MAG: hypothetical protein KatS3mg056_2441 [Chloroflexus sp.]
MWVMHSAGGGSHRRRQVVSEPEAHAPSVCRHTPTPARPRWGREFVSSQWGDHPPIPPPAGESPYNSSPQRGNHPTIPPPSGGITLQFLPPAGESPYNSSPSGGIAFPFLPPPGESPYNSSPSGGIAFPFLPPPGESPYNSSPHRGEVRRGAGIAVPGNPCGARPFPTPHSPDERGLGGVVRENTPTPAPLLRPTRTRGVSMDWGVVIGHLAA